MLLKGVMNRDNPDYSTTSLPMLAIFRGLFSRVARRLGVDPSFVSRVARGERNSPSVRAALDAEMQVIREHLNNHHNNHNNHHNNNHHPLQKNSANGEHAKPKTATTRPSSLKKRR